MKEIKLIKGYYFEGSIWALISLLYGMLFGASVIALAVWGGTHPGFEDTTLGGILLIILGAHCIAFFAGVIIYLIYNFAKLCELWFK